MRIIKRYGEKKLTAETKFKETEIGMIPEDWEVQKLTDFISHTVDNRGKSAPTSDIGIPLIATNCIKEDGLYPTKEKIRYVSEETYKDWFRDHPQPDDIIIVNKGTPGQVCLVPDPVDFCIAQDMIAIRPDTEKINGRYLFAYMRSKYFKQQVDTLNVGTTIPHLKKTVFSKLIIPIPKKEEQAEIGNIYYNISQKIDLNHQMNSNLEQIAQALFKRWFIDFEFPDENGNPYKSSGGGMVDSELGEIPGGWGVKKVDETLELAYGKSLKEDTRLPGSVPVYGSNGQVGWHNQKLVDGPGIVVGRKGNPGTVNWVHTHFYPIDTTFYVILKAPVKSLYYILYALKKQDLPSLAADSAVPGLNRNMVYMNRMIVPQRNILDLFDIYLNEVFQKIQVNEEQSRVLGSIRDSLLPKLMSGKIRVQI